MFRLFEAMFQGWLRAEWTLDRVIDKAVTLAITLLTIAGTVWLYLLQSRRASLPPEDNGWLWQVTKGPADAS